MYAMFLVSEVSKPDRSIDSRELQLWNMLFISLMCALFASDKVTCLSEVQ